MKPLRLGIVSWTATYWPYYLGLSEGTFANEDIDLQLVTLGTTSEGVRALLENRVDVAATCPDALIEAATRGAALRIAGGLINHPVSSLIARPGIESCESLRGRKIGVTEAHGSVSIFLRAFLEMSGLRAGDYQEVVADATPKQVSALQAGTIDAAMLTHPFETLLLKQGFVRLGNVGETLGPCAFTTLNVREGLTEQEIWGRLQQALQSVDKTLPNPANKGRVMASLAKATGVEKSGLAETYHLYVEAGDVLAPAGRLDRRGLQRLLDFMHHQGMDVPAGARPEMYLDTRAAISQ